MLNTKYQHSREDYLYIYIFFGPPVKKQKLSLHKQKTAGDLFFFKTANFFLIEHPQRQ